MVRKLIVLALALGVGGGRDADAERDVAQPPGREPGALAGGHGRERRGIELEGGRRNVARQLAALLHRSRDTKSRNNPMQSRMRRY